MNTETKVFLKKKLKEYYWRHTVAAPPEVHRREFGVGTLDDKIKFRHKGFTSERELNQYLKTEAPYYISYSTAYYEYPMQPMTDKHWLGADLVFDLDKPMDTLNQERFDEVKGEAIYLVRFLMDDFGLDTKEVSVNFSGSKGYHIHVHSEDVKPLDSDARREIVDYISGAGLDLEYFIRYDRGSEGITFKRGRPQAKVGVRVGPRKDSRGWAKRIYDVMEHLITASEEELLDIGGVGRKTAEKITANRERNIRYLAEGRWDALWNQFSSNIKKRIYDKALPIKDADKQVTADTSRLIRLPDTIHGGSGLLAKQVADLDGFNPLIDAVAFKGPSVKVDIKSDVKAFQVAGNGWGPYRAGDSVRVDEAAAVYLMLKDKAEYVDI